MKQTYSNKFLECDLTADNAIAFRRALGMEQKDRVPVRIMIERELIEAANSRPRSGELSNMINMGLNLYLVQVGRL